MSEQKKRKADGAAAANVDTEGRASKAHKAAAGASACDQYDLKETVAPSKAGVVSLTLDSSTRFAILSKAYTFETELRAEFKAIQDAQLQQFNKFVDTKWAALFGFLLGSGQAAESASASASASAATSAWTGPTIEDVSANPDRGLAGLAPMAVDDDKSAAAGESGAQATPPPSPAHGAAAANDPSATAQAATSAIAKGSYAAAVAKGSDVAAAASSDANGAASAAAEAPVDSK